MLLSAVVLAMACAAVTTSRGTSLLTDGVAKSSLMEVVELHQIDIATWSIIWLFGLLVSRISNPSSKKGSRCLSISTTDNIQTAEYQVPGSPSIIVRTPCGLRSALKGSRQRFFDECTRSGVSFSEKIRPPGTSTVKDTQAEELTAWKNKCSELKKGTARNTKDLLHEQQLSAEIQREREDIQNDLQATKEQYEAASVQTTSRKKACNAAKLKGKTHETVIRTAQNDIQVLTKKIKEEREHLDSLTASYNDLLVSIPLTEQSTADDENRYRQTKITLFQNKLKADTLCRTGSRLKDQLLRVRKVHEALSKLKDDEENENE
eukprot:TRINITY_DN2772_c0_g1_i1.p1 TRINITY_DN2772_c0_g1~~TRINITY_DN2772_c0_g1_i1.p1  ORF type:complete len:334 (+),score=59.77 TRINITY_DN2772_c0_g1_i1:45-1004(+)